MADEIKKPETPAQSEPTGDASASDAALSTDEVKLVSKPGVIRPLKPAANGIVPPSARAAEPDAPAVRFDPPRPESVPQRQDSLPERPFAKPDPTRETAVLSDNNPILRRMMGRASGSGTSHLSEGYELLLVIRGMVERVMMVEGRTYKLGRFEMATRKDDEIDLSPYGALDRGVSRVHAELSIQGDQIYVTDLTSTNGTYLGGQRLKPNEATLLRKGDELLIGRLPVQVLFR